MFEHHELIPIPEPENSNQKEVFAFFGLAAFYAQVLEQGMLNMIVALRIRGMDPMQGIHSTSIYDALNRHTLGRMLHEIRDHIQLNEGTEAVLQEALRARNHLSHGFFAEHDVDFGSSLGCAKMIEELRATTRLLQKADKLVEEITLPLWERLGVTREILEAELQRMLAEITERERSG